MTLCFAAARNVVSKPFGVLGLLLSSTLILLLNNGGALQNRAMFVAEAVPVTEAVLLLEKRSKPEWAQGVAEHEDEEVGKVERAMHRQKRELEEAKLREGIDEDEASSPGQYTDFDGTGMF